MSKSYMAVPPGATIEEVYLDRGFARASFTASMELQDEEILMLIDGKSLLTIEIAKKLEAVLSIPAYYWLALEANYRDMLVRITTENLREIRLRSNRKSAPLYRRSYL